LDAKGKESVKAQKTAADITKKSDKALKDYMDAHKDVIPAASAGSFADIMKYITDQKAKLATTLQDAINFPNIPPDQLDSIKAANNAEVVKLDKAMADISAGDKALAAQLATATNDLRAKLAAQDNAATVVASFTGQIKDMVQTEADIQNKTDAEELINKQQQSLSIISILAMLVSVWLLNRGLYNVMELGIQLAGVGSGATMGGMVTNFFKSGDAIVGKITGTKGGGS
jgi:hypothetical protein